MRSERNNLNRRAVCRGGFANPPLSGCLSLALIAVVVAVLGAGRALGQTPDDWTAPYRPAMLPAFAEDMLAHADAPRYAIDITLSVTPDEAQITGHQTVTYTNRAGQPLDTVVFRLYPNLNSFGGEMAVSNVAVDDIAVAAALDTSQTVVTIPLASPLPPGARVQIDLDFAVKVFAERVRLDAQFSYRDGVVALPNAYPMLAVYEPGSGWWQVTDHPQGDVAFSETAFYLVTVTAPATWVLAASGTEVGLATNPDGTLTHRYVAPLMRDFALMASEHYVAVEGEQDGVRITAYYQTGQPNATPTARAGLDMTRDAMRVYDAAFGPYPFAELDVVQTPTSAGGIEYPGLFVVAQSVWNKDDSYFEFVIAHEAAHQWWYSLVGSDPTRHPWMDEALAQYSVAVYIHDLEGAFGYNAAIGSYRALYEAYIEVNNDQTIGEPVIAYPGNAYFYLVYEKGPLLFAGLADTYGYDGVIAMLRDYFEAYRYQIAAPDAMLASFEQSSGDQLDVFFADWLGGVIPVG